MSSSVRNVGDPFGVDKSPIGEDQAPNAKYPGFRDRLRSAALDGKFSQTSLAKALKINGSTFGRYWNGERLPPSDTLIDLAEVIGVSPAWLIKGLNGHTSLRSADDAAWVDLKEYDLRTISIRGKGEPIGTTPFRMDWLYLALGANSGLWITRTLGSEQALGLPSGAPVFCKDHPEGESPVEGQHYLFFVNGGIVLARFSFRGGGFAIGDRIGEAVVTPADLVEGDNQHFIIARVVGALARPL